VRRTLILLMALALLVVGVSSSASAASGPPDRHEETFPIVFPDFENGYAVFINTTRELVCTDGQIAFEEWILGGEVGPPPGPGFQFEGIDPIAIQSKMVGDGVIVQLAKGSNLPTELWELDDPADLGVGPCTDTDDKDEKFAEGTSRWQGNDNDLFGSDTRGNAFGDRGVASLTGVQDGESYTYTHRFHVNSRCYVPEAGPPACLLDSAMLR
jgi:hypothetical protein